MPTVLPTHTCFDDATEILVAIVENPALDIADFRLVHAIVCPYGDAMAHAWVEDIRQRRAIFQGVVDAERQTLVVHVAEYYAELHVIDMTRYTLGEALGEEQRTGWHSGPWKEEYRELCRDKSSTAKQKPAAAWPRARHTPGFSERGFLRERT